MRHDSSDVLAHGVGGRSDLPIPAEYAFAAAVAALVVSFAVLALAWRGSRFRGDAAGRPVAGPIAAVVDSKLVRGLVVALALTLAAWVSMAAIFGADSLVNPTFGAVYALLWVGLVPAALLFGPIYRLCNPLRWLHQGLCLVARIDPAAGVTSYPVRLGLWPAALLLFAFVWLELVDPNTATDLTWVTLWFAVVGVVLLLGATVYGDTWFAHALTRSRCTPLWWPACRRTGAKVTAPWWCATRSTTSTESLLGRDSSAWSRCCSGRRRSTASGSRAAGCGSLSSTPTRRHC